MSRAPEPARPFATEGQRLRDLVNAAWTGGGGVRGLSKASGVTPEALYSWFRGENLPSLTSVRSLADQLEMRPVDVVAAIDGVTAPKQQETPRPEWAEGLEERIAETLVARFSGAESIPDRVAERVAARLGLPLSPSDEGTPEEGATPRGGEDTALRRTG